MQKFSHNRQQNRSSGVQGREHEEMFHVTLKAGHWFLPLKIAKWFVESFSLQNQINSDLKQIEHYAQMYGVSDVRSFVHRNCAFAKMYLPTVEILLIF